MAIYVREAKRSHPCVTRARSAMSTGFIMTTHTIRIRHPHRARTSCGVVSTRIRCCAVDRHRPCDRRAPLSSAPLAAPVDTRRASRRVVPNGAC
ncbi:hypothetical protein C6T65_30020 [Burkholderia vietnamiensis]|nr:hypothetical protein C6T65_30020 [Burkholderia vietnamiensis]